MRKFYVIIILCLFTVAACTQAPRPLVAPPLHEADLYPNATTVADLTIAIDEISDPARAKDYFGKDLTRDAILPVMLVFTNRSDGPFLVKPGDVLLYEGNSVIDPIPAERLTRDEGLARAMKDTVVQPGQTYQGILFYRVRKRDPGLYKKVEKLFLDRLKMRVVVTDQESGERIPLGTFPINGL